MAKPEPKPDDPAQSKRFIDLAGELGANSTPEAFDRAVGKIASAQREAPPKPKKRANKA